MALTRHEIEHDQVVEHHLDRQAMAMERLADSLEKLVEMIGRLPAPGQGIYKKG